MTKHTELPYATDYTGNIWGDADNELHDGDLPLIGKSVKPDDAAFITLACNSFYELLEALKPFADIGVGTNPDYTPTIRLDRNAVIKARTALSKATPNTEEAKGER